MEESFKELINAELASDLQENISKFKMLLHAEINSDVHFRYFEISGCPLCVLYIEGMADERRIGELVLRACSACGKFAPEHVDAEYLIRSVLEIAQCESEHRVRPILEGVVSGMSAIFVEGCSEAVLMETRGYPARQVNRTTNESVVIGAQEGFVEPLTGEQAMDAAAAVCPLRASAITKRKVSKHLDGTWTITFGSEYGDFIYMVDGLTGEILEKTEPDIPENGTPAASSDPFGDAISACFSSLPGYRGGAENIKVSMTSRDGQQAVMVTFDWNGEPYTMFYGTETQKLLP